MKRKAIIADAAGEVESIGEAIGQRADDDVLLRGLALRLETLAGVIMSAVDGEPREGLLQCLGRTNGGGT